MSTWLVSALSVLLFFGQSGGAFASQYSSRYSDLDFAKCEIVEEDSEFGFVQWKCAGAYGYDIYVTEADLRIYISYRPEGYVKSSLVEERGTSSSTQEGTGDAVVPEENVWDELGQTLPPFNTLGPKLEWRALSEGGAGPFATIVRYYYQMPDDQGGFEDGQVLVVSRFRDGRSCQVAYIDALANANANLMAREVADGFSNGGDCPEGAVPIVGKGGDAFRF